MSNNEKHDEFYSRLAELAKKSKHENRMIMNHICIRVEDMEKAQKLFAESFGIGDFVAEAGTLYKGENAVSGAWINDEFYIELMEPTEKQKIGYDTGCAVPIGHLSEIGFLTPDMDAELARLSKLGWKVTESMSSPESREAKLDMDPPAGIPIELMELNTDTE